MPSGANCTPGAGIEGFDGYLERWARISAVTLQVCVVEGVHDAPGDRYRLAVSTARSLPIAMRRFTVSPGVGAELAKGARELAA
jgi:hypothetical protein